MPSSATLEHTSKELATKISAIETDAKMTDAEKITALEAIKPDWEAHTKALELSEKASEMRGKLGPAGEAKDADGVDIPALHARNLKSIRNELGAGLLRHPEYRKALKELDDFNKPRGKFDLTFSVSAKDATSGANLVGEGLYGATGPAAAGQNPFLPGAFGAGIQPQWIPGVVEQLFYELTIADLIPSMPTTSPNLSYMTESTVVRNAAAVAEGGTFPFSSEEFSRVYEQIGKIGNAATATDEVVRDAPELFAFLQSAVIDGVVRQEEIQLLAGPGGGVGPNGLLNRSSGFTQTNASSLGGDTATTASNVTFGNANGSGALAAAIATLNIGRVVTGASGLYPTPQAIAEAVLFAFTDIHRSVFRNPNAIIMNPLDWALIRTAKDENGQYMGPSFFGFSYGNSVSAAASLWNVPVIQTYAIPQGYVLTGLFDRTILQAARREGINFQMTNTNGTDFVEGKVTMRAEERLGLMVYRPSAFQLIQLKAGA